MLKRGDRVEEPIIAYILHEAIMVQLKNQPGLFYILKCTFSVSRFTAWLCNMCLCVWRVSSIYTSIRPSIETSRATTSCSPQKEVSSWLTLVRKLFFYWEVTVGWESLNDWVCVCASERPIAWSTLFYTRVKAVTCEHFNANWIALISSHQKQCIYMYAVNGCLTHLH